jgi:hypothetical protein
LFVYTNPIGNFDDDDCVCTRVFENKKKSNLSTRINMVHRYRDSITGKTGPLFIQKKELKSFQRSILLV